jgi:hypothetical protein
MELITIRSVFGRSSYLMLLLLHLVREKRKMMRRKRLSEIICIKRSPMQIEVDWLKKDRLSGMSVSEKVKYIEDRNKTLSISRQCELLQLVNYHHKWNIFTNIYEKASIFFRNGCLFPNLELLILHRRLRF